MQKNCTNLNFYLDNVLIISYLIKKFNPFFCNITVFSISLRFKSENRESGKQRITNQKLFLIILIPAWDILLEECLQQYSPMTLNSTEEGSWLFTISGITYFFGTIVTSFEIRKKWVYTNWDPDSPLSCDLYKKVLLIRSLENTNGFIRSVNFSKKKNACFKWLF